MALEGKDTEGEKNQEQKEGILTPLLKMYVQRVGQSNFHPTKKQNKKENAFQLPAKPDGIF